MLRYRLLYPLGLALTASMAGGSPSGGAEVVVDWDFTAAHNLAAPGNAVPVGLGSAVLAGTEATTDPRLLCSDMTAESAWEGDPCNPSGLYWSGGGFVEYGELNLQQWDGDYSAGCGASNDGVNDNYLSFTLTAAGAPIEVSRISIRCWRNGTGAPGTYAMEVIADGGAPTAFGVPANDLDQGDLGFDWFQFDDSITATASLEIRFRPAASGGGLGTGNLHIDGLLVEKGTDGGDPNDGPNVLFVIADDLTASALACYGNPLVETPNIDRLAERGMLFERAYCQYPVCSVSRPSLMASWYPTRISGNLDAALGDHHTLPEHFRVNGYTAARVSKIYHMRVPGDITSGAPGPDHAPSWNSTFNVTAPEWMTPGNSGHYTNGSLDFSQPTAHYNLGFGTEFYVVEGFADGSEQADALATDEAISLLGQLKDGPFFLAVGFVRPHVPLVAPSNMFGLYDPTTIPLADSVPGDLLDIPSAGIFWNEPSRGPNNDSDRRHVLQAYYATVSFMDEQLGRLLDRLDELELTDDTLIVFTSDHGYHLGEHTFWQKLSLHEESARVPLIIAGPGVTPDTTNGGLTELIDIYPTLADLAGLEVPPPCQGTSLKPVLAGTETSVRSAALCSISGGHLLRTEEWAYMRYNDGTAELYTMAPPPSGDPKQFWNLANDPAYATIRQELDAQLDAKLFEAAAEPAQPFCFGDGNPYVCPCGNESVIGDREGCLNSTGVGAVLSATGSTSVTSDNLVLHMTQGPPNQFSLLIQGNEPKSLFLGDGIQCVGSPIVRLEVILLDATGSGSSTDSMVTKGGVSPGDTRYYQQWFRDPGPGSACGNESNLTNGLIVRWN
jgi:iduronate 2-sulfatase